MLRDTFTVKMDLKQTNICYLCNKEEETLSHSYDLCVVIRRLWERFKMWFKGKTGVNWNLNLVSVLFNVVRLANSTIRFICYNTL